MAQTKVVSLDGSHGEGGGQIVRTATALSAITGTPCRITNIRLNRANPGLRHQHLIGLRALSRLCDATLEGDEIGSTEISFYPGSIKAASLDVGIKTAGSTTLALQTLLLPSFFAPAKVHINFHGGATDTFFSPTIDYHRFVFSQILERLGLGADIDIVRRGFYPRGGAEMEVEIFPAKVSNWKPDGRGTLRNVLIMSVASEILRPRRVAERQAEAAGEKLKNYFDSEIEVNIEYSPSVSAGSTICIAADFERTTIGVDGLGRRGKMAEAVGEETADAFLMEYNSGACLDAHAGDQILPFLSFAEGKSEFTVSTIHKHTTTNIWVIGHFVDKKIEIESIGTKSAVILQ